MKYRYKRTNPKVVALIIEIVLLVGVAITASILDSLKKLPNMIPVVVITLVLVFALVLTLSLIRYDSMRDIRADGSFKGTNLPLYTDETTLLGHDIKDEGDETKH